MAQTAYCAHTDVAERFKGISFATGTTILRTTVDQWILDAGSEIEGRLALRYVVPITGTNALAIIKNIVADMVAERVREVLEAKGIFESVDQENGGKDKSKPAKTRIEEILSGMLLLNDATALSSAQGVKSYSSENCVTRVFQKDVKQW